MIGDMLNNNKRREVKTREDQVMYYGKKYRQDKKTGYYVCTSGDRKRLHVAMWEAEAGIAVPPGCVIHHVDWDKSHNEINNLVCVTISEHERIHNATDAQIRAGIGGKEFGEKLKKERGLNCPPGL